jgi:ligand-binding SRPBCC domain-containing protein
MEKRRRTFEGSSKCSAPASTVWAVWTNPSLWPGGVIESAKIDGNFVVGAKLTDKTKGGPTTTATVTLVDPPRMWVDVSKFPGLRMTFEHVIEAADEGTVLTERVIISGLLAAVAARLMGSRLEQTFAGTTSRIACLAEAHG